MLRSNTMNALVQRLAGAAGGILLLLAGCSMASQPLSSQAQALDLQTPAVAVAGLDAATQQAMIEAINDEYHARAYYSAVLEKFGDVRPFSNIVQAEDRHVQLWEGVFTRYGLPIPADSFASTMTAPDTLLEACQAGVAAELADANMYETFLATIDEPDLRSVFTRLREVSLEKHLPAFERCVANGGQPCLGQGRGRGRGQGQGRNR